MPEVQVMFGAHPEPVQVDMDMLVRCIDACYDCARTCTFCADACLSEDEVQMLVRCIRLNMDCTSICELTGRILLRLTQPDWSINRSLLEACESACRICGDECERHGEHYKHCQLCADSCRVCEQACSHMLNAVSTAV